MVDSDATKTASQQRILRVPMVLVSCTQNLLHFLMKSIQLLLWYLAVPSQHLSDESTRHINFSFHFFLSGSIFRTWLFIVDVLVIVRNWNEFKASLSVKFSFIYCFTQIDYQSPPNGDFSLKNMGKVILYSFSPSKLFSPKNLRK